MIPNQDLPESKKEKKSFNENISKIWRSIKKIIKSFFV